MTSISDTNHNGDKKEEPGSVVVSVSDLPLTEKELEILREKDDPWAVTTTDEKGTPWSELSCGKKLWRVIVSLVKIILMVAFLYLFICALGFLSDAFKLVGGKTAGKAFRENDLLKNPVAGLMIGVLATVLLQSSSTTTSIIITMVGAGIVPLRTAIPMVMGSNIGTSVTNTIVSLAQSSDREEFRKAFGGATVHDMFNWLTVIILLPIEIIFGYLYYLTGAIVDRFEFTESADHDKDILKIVTRPFTDKIVKINKDVISDIAINKDGAEDGSVLKRWCVFDKIPYNASVHHEEQFLTGHVNQSVIENLNSRHINYTELYSNNGQNETIAWNATETKINTVHIGRCENLFAKTDLSDDVIGFILLAISLVLIVVSLICIVKILNSLLKGSVAKLIKKTINSNLPGKLAFLTGYIAILVGTGMTMILQSSSVFTSTLTPLVGVGVVSLERMYPLTLGSNIGTTLTGILAALAAPASEIKRTLHLALCHLFFNITGVLIFYPVPFMRKAPIGLAKMLGNTTSKYRWFSILYLIVMFFVLPGAIFGLSMAGPIVIMAVGIPILVILAIIVVINIMQRKCSRCLPQLLRTWDFLPLFMHSLDPLDRVISKLTEVCKCGRDKVKQKLDTDKPSEIHVNNGYQFSERL